MQNGPNSPAGASAEWQPPNSADGPDQSLLSKQEVTDTTGVTHSCRTTRTGTQIPHTTYSLSDSISRWIVWTMNTASTETMTKWSQSPKTTTLQSWRCSIVGDKYTPSIHEPVFVWEMQIWTANPESCTSFPFIIVIHVMKTAKKTVLLATCPITNGW